MEDQRNRTEPHEGAIASCTLSCGPTEWCGFFGTLKLVHCHTYRLPDVKTFPIAGEVSVLNMYFVMKIFKTRINQITE